MGQGKFCNVDQDAKGVISDTKACAGDSSKGITAATAATCYCGTDATVTAKDKFCNVVQDPKGVISDTKACTGVDGKTKADATCSCGTDKVAIAKDEYCFVKAAKTGVKSAAAAPSCGGTASNGLVAATAA